MNDEILFAPEDKVALTQNSDVWKMLVVDDDVEVHSFTTLAFHDFFLHGKSIQISSAYSSAQAIDMLRNQDYAVVLLDVVMETNDAGFKVIDFLRHVKNDKKTRIIIRTGQPGEAPERFVIEHYDINDYKEKTELTTDKLYTTIRTALAQYEQISELQQNRDDIYLAAIKDKLTGLPNRFKLNEELGVNQTMTLMIVNIDDFSFVNDSYGFDIGDKLLLQVKHKLLKTLEPYKMDIYHLEADVFAALYKDRIDEKINELVETIKLSLSDVIYEIDGISLHISMTVGIVKDDVSNMIQKAETALREARMIGKSRVEIYSDKLQIIQQVYNNNKWASWIRDALDSDKILVYYQPIVECATGNIVKYEALVRLEKEGVVYSPFHFLSAARYAGLLHKLTRRVIQIAFERFSGSWLSVSINITDVDLMESGFIDFIESTRMKYSLERNQICFELLEETSLSENRLAQKQIRSLLDFGYRIVIDDFGVQCSNFAQMGTVKLDSIKIDGKFIKDLDENIHSRNVTESIVFFATKAGFSLVAEFVHSSEIYELVRSLGIQYAQGYYLGEPQPYLL